MTFEKKKSFCDARVGGSEVGSLIELMCERYLFKSSWLMWSLGLFLDAHCSSLVNISVVQMCQTFVSDGSDSCLQHLVFCALFDLCNSCKCGSSPRSRHFQHTHGGTVQSVCQCREAE